MYRYADQKLILYITQFTNNKHSHGTDFFLPPLSFGKIKCFCADTLVSFKHFAKVFQTLILPETIFFFYLPVVQKQNFTVYLSSLIIKVITRK